MKINNFYWWWSELENISSSAFAAVGIQIIASSGIPSLSRFTDLSTDHGLKSLLITFPSSE
jgi:hypothetical protein